MAGGGDKIELFKFIKTIFQHIGLVSSQSKPIRRSFNWKNWFFLIGNAQFFISSAAYLLLEANSLLEYGRVFCNCTLVIAATAFYFLLLWQLDNILIYIRNCEGFIEKSK